MHVAVGFRGLVEANAAIVSVADELGEFFLAEVALHFAAEAAGTECESSHLHVRLTERYPFRRRVLRQRFEWQRGAKRNRACGERSGLKKVSARMLAGAKLARHGSPHSGE